MQRINETFYKYLKDAIPTEVDVYPVVADESAQYPFCTFRMEAFEKRELKGILDSYLFTYTASVWGSSFNQVDRIVTKLMAAVQGQFELRFDVPIGHMKIMLTRGESDIDEQGFVQHLTFEIRYRGDAV